MHALMQMQLQKRKREEKKKPNLKRRFRFCRGLSGCWARNNGAQSVAVWNGGDVSEFSQDADATYVMYKIAFEKKKIEEAGDGSSSWIIWTMMNGESDVRGKTKIRKEKKRNEK